ncbi:hypothetical protein [Planctomycetes bacterium TBK1r]|uniref:Uncharacterized protein n=1 Tax=Stieleria magnilauensis TaxID=2527963 RepID=A0ABX5XTQ2_9BACT|nr:hypothetical protein TBK1r_39290 [Planctomycetes bacterium TBK1r]
MTFEARINFRETAGHVADHAGETYCLGSDYLSTDAYPVSRDGLTFGHEDSGGVYTTARQGSDLGSPYNADPNTAGSVRYNSGNFFDSFRLDLPHTGVFAIRIIAARPDLGFTDGYFRLYDGETLVYSVPTTLANHTVGNVTDIMGRQVHHATASAAGGFNGSVFVHDFASTTLRLIATTDDYLSYLEVIEQAFRPAIKVGPPDANRNDFGGDVGYRFTPVRDISVTHLGRPTDASAGMAQDHEIMVWRDSDAAQVTSCTVTPASTLLNGHYIEPCTPVTLTAGTAYRVSSSEFVGGDSWINDYAVADFDASMMSIAGRCYSVTPGSFPSAAGGAAGSGYVHQNLYETIGGAAPSSLLKMMVHHG